MAWHPRTVGIFFTLPNKDFVFIRCYLKFIHINYYLKTKFYVSFSVMEKKKACLISLFKRLSSSFRKESHEHITTLQGALEFCQLLIMVDDSSLSRTLIVSPSELANYLGWKPGGYEMQFSKYTQDKKDTVKKEEKEKEKPCKEEAVEEHCAEKEEEPAEKEGEVEVKQEEAEAVEEKKEEIKREEVKKEEPRKEEETQERIHPLKLLEKQVVVSTLMDV